MNKGFLHSDSLHQPPYEKKSKLCSLLNTHKVAAFVERKRKTIDKVDCIFNFASRGPHAARIHVHAWFWLPGQAVVRRGGS